MDWVDKEYGSIDLKDKRLNNRAKKLLKQLASNPSSGIPTNCKSWKEIKAAYRFFDHPVVNAKNIIKPHRVATFERIQKQPVVLFIQDTTALNYSGQKNRKDIGPLQCDEVRGIYLHPTLAVTPDCECLGIADYYQWVREKLAHLAPNERSSRNYQRPLKEKESKRWLNGYKKINKLANKIPETQCIYIADRESDLYAIYHEFHRNVNKHHASWIIRASQNRSFLDKENNKGKIKAAFEKSEPLGIINFEIAAGRNRKKRSVTQEVFSKGIILQPPKNRKDRNLKPVKTTIIVAREVNPPLGEKPIEWILLTSIVFNDFEDAKKIIDWYRCRWQIENYFKILKSGCQIEKLQINTKERFDPCLALYLVIAWRILFLTMLGRTYPNLSSECVFETVEWQTAFVIHYKKKPPKKAPSLDTIMKIIAQLGGFIGARETFEQVFGHTYG